VPEATQRIETKRHLRVIIFLQRHGATGVGFAGNSWGGAIMAKSGMSRRDLLKTAGVLAGTSAAGFWPEAATGAGLRAGGVASPKSAVRGTIAASDTTNIVETTSGKVRGYTRNGIYTFKGIPYGATTAGEARFMPPSKAKPWTGVRSSMQFGYVAPQGPRGGWANDEEAWMFSWEDGIQNEDCLHVNVWTPGINDNKKRPVMVWLHGGGFVAGSGQELRSYDGENLCHRGDVVVVSLNHRLGVLGHIDLSQYGSQFASSGNVGMLDIVLALEWVRDNIGNFGGDASNVTIFGQSGGGGKVNTLLAMPSAKGLFHRAITQSGSMLRGQTTEKSAQVAAEFLSQLGLSGSQLDELQKIPYAKLIEVGAAIAAKGRPPGPPDVRKMASQLSWAPVVDGKVLATHPYDPVAPGLSANVPVMVGTVLNEFVSAINHPELEAMTEEEAKKRATVFYGEHTDDVFNVFRNAHPKDKIFDVYSLMMTAPVRQGAVTQAELKAAQGGAPAYLYWFTWKTPVLDGRPRAFHCAELAFCFDNVERCENMTGNGPEAHDLAARVSEAWLSFARKGDPNHAGLPHWPAFTAEKCPTMIFDTPCTVKENPDTAERKVIPRA
jgi:para-nitrobenzyl esterase